MFRKKKDLQSFLRNLKVVVIKLYKKVKILEQRMREIDERVKAIEITVLDLESRLEELEKNYRKREKTPYTFWFSPHSAFQPVTEITDDMREEVKKALEELLKI